MKSGVGADFGVDADPEVHSSRSSAGGCGNNLSCTRGALASAATAAAGGPPVSGPGAGTEAALSAVASAAVTGAGAGAAGGAGAGCAVGAELAAVLTAAAISGPEAAVLAFDGAVVEHPALASASQAKQAASRIPRLTVDDIYTSTSANISLYINVFPSVNGIRRRPVAVEEISYVGDLDTLFAHSHQPRARSVMPGLGKSSHMARCGTLDPRRRYKMSHRSTPYDDWHAHCLYICSNGPFGRGKEAAKAILPFELTKEGAS